jgi:hypothetical protein
MIILRPLKDADGSGRHRSQEIQRLYRDELSRVRAAALAWRNGLGALLGGIIGFSLIKGRSDIGQLTIPWSISAGVLLLGALLAGGYGAMHLLRAAHGRPRVLERAQFRSAMAADHYEAVESQRSL